MSDGRGVSGQIGLSFDAVDPPRAPAVAEIVRALGTLVRGMASCEVGADRLRGRIRVRVRTEGEVDSGTLRRMAFWAARAGGRASALPSAAEAALFELALGGCALVVRDADPLRAFAAIRAEFARGAGAPALAPMSPDAPVLSLQLDGPGAEGVTYDAAARELFLPSPLAPPLGDELVLQLDAPRRRSSGLRARVRVVDSRPPGSRARRAPSGFTVALLQPGPGHALLVALCPSPLARETGRAQQRHRVHGRVEVRDAAGSGAPARGGYLRDLSVDGAFIRTGSPAAPGERVRIGARLPGGAILDTGATVVHVRSDGMGVRFDAECSGLLAPALTALTGRRRRVLVVDDDQLARAMLSDAFRERGWDVVSAPNAALGLHALTEHLFSLDLLVTDVRMPGFDGTRLVHAIRQLGGERDLPIVVITASLDDAVRAELEGLGADAVLSKSAGVEAIAEAAGAAVERRPGSASVARLA
jgi:CheY-like chemotaxis protein